MTIEQDVCGLTADGEAIVLYTMRADDGSEVTLSTLGATVVGIKVPDGSGVVADVLLGYKNYEQYLRDRSAVGRCIGRTAGRVADADIEVGGERFALDANGGYCHVDGGAKGFGARLWEGRVETNRVVMSLCSEDGDQGYPGELQVEVIFDFDDEGTLEITYLAKSSRATAVDLTHNLFFNLSGEGCGNILDHELRVCSSHIIDTDTDNLATGQLTDVASSQYDFKEFRPIGGGESLSTFRGYNICFAVDGRQRNILSEVAVLRDPTSHREVTVLSSQAAVEVTTGNNLACGCPETKSGGRYSKFDGVSLSCRNYPDATHHHDFPSIILNPDELYCQKTVYRFSHIV